MHHCLVGVLLDCVVLFFRKIFLVCFYTRTSIKVRYFKNSKNSYTKRLEQTYLNYKASDWIKCDRIKCDRLKCYGLKLDRLNVMD